MWFKFSQRNALPKPQSQIALPVSITKHQHEKIAQHLPEEW